jgi:hypothetical protein
VHAFNLTNNPKAERAYAWSSPIEGSDKLRFAETDKINSPVVAVRAAIVAEHKQGRFQHRAKILPGRIYRPLFYLRRRIRRGAREALAR